MQYSKIQTWLIAGVIITLLLGITIGMLTDRLLSIQQYHRLSQKGRHAHVLAEEHLLKRLSRKLDLSQAQIQVIGGILRVQSVKIKNIKDDYNQKMSLIIKDSQDRIKQHLSPQQKEKYEKLISSHRQKWKKLNCR